MEAHGRQEAAKRTRVYPRINVVPPEVLDQVPAGFVSVRERVISDIIERIYEKSDTAREWGLDIRSRIINGIWAPV